MFTRNYSEVNSVPEALLDTCDKQNLGSFVGEISEDCLGNRLISENLGNSIRM
jgi:hypothetical protein